MKRNQTLALIPLIGVMGIALALWSLSQARGTNSEYPRGSATPDTSARSASTDEWTVSVIAGVSQLRPDALAADGGFADGPAGAALFNRPVGMAATPDGFIYIADSGNHRIRVLTPDGDVRTVAGSGEPGSADGPALSATFRTPVDLTFGPGGVLYVVDAEAGQVRAIDNGQVRTVAGVDVIACQLAAEGVSPTTTPAGCPERAGEAPFRDGPAATALFHQPTSVAVGSTGDLFVVDSSNQVIRRISPNGDVSTYAGAVGQPGNADGRRLDARFFFPVKVVIAGGDLYLTEGSRIRRVSGDGQVTTLAGSRAQGFEAADYEDGPGLTARFNAVTGMALRTDGSLLLADTGNQRIRVLDAHGVVSSLAGRGGQGLSVGRASDAQFSLPAGIVVLADGSILVSDFNLHRIFLITR